MDERQTPGKFADIGKMDIYLIDQLQKGRINKGMKILDAGFGRGRNLEYFVKNDFDIYGIDRNTDYIREVSGKITRWNSAFPADRLMKGKLEELPWQDDVFDFVFSIAVLHFAESHGHFKAMFDELIRVLKPGGYLMFRMTSWHTFELSEKTGSGMAEISDGRRYMLDINTLKKEVARKGLKLSDPVKTTNVDGLRTMTTVVIQK